MQTDRQLEQLALGLAQARHDEQVANRSQVPIAFTRGPTHEVVFANVAFGVFLQCDPSTLVGRSFLDLCPGMEQLGASLSRAVEAGVIELLGNLAFVTPNGDARHGATVVHPGEDGPSYHARLEVIDLTDPTEMRLQVVQHADDLRHANERLLLASLREYDLAERAELATQRTERLLHRKSMLADAGTLLSSSLDPNETLQRTAQLGVSGPATCCFVQLEVEGGPALLGVAHATTEKAAWLGERLEGCARDPELRALMAGPLQAVQSTHHVVLPIESLGSEPGTDATGSVLRMLDARASLAVPLEARGKILGAMLLLACSPGRGFEPEDVEFVGELARRASLAIDNANLYHEAQQAVRTREDVLNIVSHDLRNPLGAITMSVERLLRVLPPAEAGDPKHVRAGCEIILRSSRHMRRLIEELLEVANIHGGRLKLDCAPVSLRKLLAQSVEMMVTSAAAYGVQLDVQLPELDLALHCDRERVVRVIANLVGNAIKFTPDGGHVWVRTSCPRQHLRVEVEDTGPGIAAEELPKLFMQYWKGEGTGRTGMGLGLYIARAIVDAHGGSIWVESKPGDGSKFVFEIPLRAAESAA